MHTTIETIVQQVGTVILGKTHQIRLAVACLLAHGHLLIEDIPGVGKTTLAHVLAKCFNLEEQRIQFTSDLLPADIIGVSIYQQKSSQFHFHSGPIFAQLIIADEINRATPKTQSALLEAMEEKQVTIEGETRPLPQPFFVIATQNPTHQIGTFPLPESQLDRFLMCIHLGYPDAEAERTLLSGQNRRAMIAHITPCVQVAELIQWQQAIHNIHISNALLDYLQAIINYTRESHEFTVGLSPRAGLALLQCARAWAFMNGKDFLIPEDIQAVLGAVIDHRLNFIQSSHNHQNIADYVINKIAIP